MEEYWYLLRPLSTFAEHEVISISIVARDCAMSAMQWQLPPRPSRVWHYDMRTHTQHSQSYCLDL